MIMKNSFYLFLLQGTNYLVPLLLLPFFVRVLGVESYGEVALWLAIIQLSFVVTDFGFTLSATRTIAKFEYDKIKISNYVSLIFVSKIILVFLVSSLVLIYSAFAELDYRLAWVAIFTISCQAYQPVWFFHGIERMSSVVTYLASSKFFYLVFVLYFVEDANDGLIVLFSWGIAQFIATLISCCEYLYRGYTFSIPKFKDVILLLKENLDFFASRVSVAAFTSMNIVVLGSVGTSAQIANFAICDQIFKAGQSLTSPVTQALYPYMQRTKDWKLYFKVTLIFLLFLVISLFVFFQFRDYFIKLIFGDELTNINQLVVIFLYIIIANFLGRNLGYPVFGGINQLSFAHRTVQFGAIIHIFLLFLLLSFDKLEPYSIAYTMLFTECLILMLRCIGIMKWRKLISY